jgi:probable F420-dependent oxidoreductase
MLVMKIGLLGVFGNSPTRDVGFIKEFSQCVELNGFNSLWAPEHVVFFDLSEYKSRYPYTKDGSPPFADGAALFDPLFSLTIASQCTTSLRFGTSVLVLPQRPALLTAKEIMTLDHLTQGRFDFGVGAGWSEEEYSALGASFERRGQRFDEYIEAIRAAWTQDRASYEGEFISFRNVVLLPKPYTPGGPPFLIGGDSNAALHRAARMGDGWYGWWVNYDLEQQLEKLTGYLERYDRLRDPTFQTKVGLYALGDLDGISTQIEEAKRLGVQEVIVSAKVGSRSLEADLENLAQAVGISA